MVRWSQMDKPSYEWKMDVLLLQIEPDWREALSRFLLSWNFSPVPAGSLEEALALLQSRQIQIVVLDDPEGRPDSFSMIRTLREKYPLVETILISREKSPEYTTEAFRAGVYSCLSQPVSFRLLGRDLNCLRGEVRRRIESRPWEDQAHRGDALEGLVGTSAPMQAVGAAIRSFARENLPVLISGRIGTGKERVARILHAQSRNAEQPLFVYRCCGISEETASQDLFGAAGFDVAGDGGSRALSSEALLVRAIGGTLLLDEVADLPLPIQRQLGRVLAHMQSGPSETAGGEETDPEPEQPMRILATTRTNLADHVRNGVFDSGLYGLLQDRIVYMPSLVERGEDIPQLAQYFLKMFNDEFGKSIRGFTRDAELALLHYGWPGNVRELENVIGRACLLAEQVRIDVGDLSIPASGVETGSTDRTEAEYEDAPEVIVSSDTVTEAEDLSWDPGKP